jgi:hypothetical protein
VVGRQPRNYYLRNRDGIVKRNITSEWRVIRPESMVEVNRQIGSFISETFVCLQSLSHDDEAMLFDQVSKRVLCGTRQTQVFIFVPRRLQNS